MFRSLLRRLRLIGHVCEEPPDDELMAVIASIGDHPVWEQRRCRGCGAIRHWKRDYPEEPFRLHMSPPANALSPFEGGGGAPMAGVFHSDEPEVISEC